MRFSSANAMILQTHGANRQFIIIFTTEGKSVSLQYYARKMAANGTNYPV